MPGTRNRVKELRTVKASELLANPLNPRIHTPAQKQALSSILDSVGYADALVARELPDGSLELIDGHLRKDLTPDDDVPVLLVDLDDDEARIVLATHDPIGMMAGVDGKAYIDLISSIQQADEQTATLLESLKENHAADFLAAERSLSDAPEPQIDRAEELHKKWQVQKGEVWQIAGRHRVICGDATDGDVVGLLGDKFDLCFSDPPYGADIQYSQHDDTQEALESLITKFFPIALAKCDVVALTVGINNLFLYPNPSWVLCWFYGAGTGRSPWGFSAWQPVVVWGNDPKLASGEGCHPDAFNYPMTRADGLERETLSHACPKPLCAWTRFLERLGNKQTKTVYDPFLGSGTTLIACEQLGRRCFGIEIDPTYVAVCLERFSDAGLSIEKVA